ncbi:MAG: hypothetical protein AABX31_01905 [Nanoarchaeota archaeon]
MKKKIIDIEAHAFFRLMERGTQFGLSFEETKERSFNAVRNGKLSVRKHKSRKGKTYYHYFNDNLSFYVMCQEREYDDYIKVLIKTVIIEEGRG